MRIALALVLCLTACSGSSDAPSAPDASRPPPEPGPCGHPEWSTPSTYLECVEAGGVLQDDRCSLWWEDGELGFGECEEETGRLIINDDFQGDTSFIACSVAYLNDDCSCADGACEGVTAATDGSSAGANDAAAGDTSGWFTFLADDKI